MCEKLVQEGENQADAELKEREKNLKMKIEGKKDLRQRSWSSQFDSAVQDFDDNFAENFADVKKAPNRNRKHKHRKLKQAKNQPEKTIPKQTLPRLNLQKLPLTNGNNKTGSHFPNITNNTSDKFSNLFLLKDQHN